MEAFPFHLCIALKQWGHPDHIHEGCEPGQALTVGQFNDWMHYHNQFNIGIDKADIMQAMHIADYRNAHKGESDSGVRPVDILWWFDPYADDDAFLATLGALGREVGEPIVISQ